MGRQGGGFGFFLQGGEALFAQGGEGYCKIAKRALQFYFSREFWKVVKNMCNFAVFRHIF